MKIPMPSKQYVVAVALLLVTLGILNVAGGYERIPEKRPFRDVPLTIGSRWHGQDLPVDQSIRDVLKADDLLMREYRDARGDVVWLYAGYYASQRAGASYHSPMNCLPGSGWTILSREEVPVAMGGRAMPINRVVIAKGMDKQLILYWYQDRGRVIPNEYWAKGYLLYDAMTKHRTDGALIRLSVPVVGSTEEAFQTGVAFLSHAAPMIMEYLPS